ncbi:usherin [Centroberyx gerrardi]
MTVITYSSAAGRLPKEIQVLEHSSAARNVPEPPSEILEPWNIPEPWENPTQESCRGKGKDGVKQEKKIMMKRTRWCDVFLWLPLLFLSLCPEPVSSQGNFPRLENIAAFKPVSTSPARSTCGVPERSSYCQFPSTQTELLGCSQAFCIQECPYRSATPPYAPLLLPAHRGTCVTEDSSDPRPGTQTEPGTRPSTSSEGVSTGSSSVVFRSVQEGCLVSPPSQNLGTLGSLTLALWIKPSTPGEMVLLEKSSGGRLVFVLAASEQAVTVRYGQSSSQPPLTVRFRTEGRVTPDRWTHLVLQVHDRRVSLFLDGLEEDGMPFDTRPLNSRLYDIREDSAMWVGLSSNGSNQFIGRMQDFRFYPATLTNREIVELYSGVLPHLHVQSECRCPPSHPRVHPLVERYCIPNAVEDTTNDRVLRLNLNAHPLSYINDQDMGTAWLSRIMAIQDMDEGVTITVDLANGQYQVFYVIVQFGGLLPESVLIQRRSRNTTEPETSTGTEQPWLDWQYMARDCSVFGLQNNGLLLRPDSVNCLQLPSEVPYSGGNITFSLLTPEPNLRPGYNDFYSTPALQRLVQATQVRIHLSGQYHTRAPGVNHRHRYYAINEITISGRCECHGHADHCDTSVTPYRCLCLPESHTEGHNCQRCAPLYNDKPFRSGDQLQPMSCRPCQCHGHARSCHYDVQADDQPDEHYRGGGGVCDNCMHNTAGKNCELCRSQFFRLEQSDAASADVCRPCNCHTAGTVNGSMECEQVGGQCRCKAAVTGRQCADCLPGWYGLQAWRPRGCVRCNCSDIGVIGTSGGRDPSCDQGTGQCQCKPHVTGLSCDRCEFGYWNLSHADGCVLCDCDPLGSLSSFCEPEGGQCECKAGVGGQRCDSCGRGSYGLRLEGSCAPCNCSKEGTVAGTECDPHTGQCVCKEHVEGRRCDSCRRGYHSLERRNSLGCLPCVCDVTGTAPEGVCDALTGQCPCQEGVEGAQCTHCAHNYYNRSSDTQEGGSHGCVPCTCDPRGTVAGTVCDSTTGQCVCVPTRHERDCSSCRPGFYLSTERSVCVECDCHPIGASQRGCEGQTGQCVCADPSVGGRRCDQCREMYYGFNPGLGRCQRCTCDPVGSVNGSCHPDSGVCVCRPLVTGDQCDVCQPGASHLDPENHLGCSKAPSQQPVPTGFTLSFSSIRLSWHPPDSPNTNRLNYTLMRDGQSVHSIQSRYPFSPESFEDTGLSPYTNYSYWLITASVAGQTESASVTYQTLAAAPEADQLHLRLVGRPGPSSASFNWTAPRNDTGPVERFLLSSLESSGAEPVIHYRGLSTEAVASGLKPFTQYTFTLEACSTGGCTSTPLLSVLTASAPPQNQPPPRVNATGPHTLHATWEPPTQPNGVITRYEVFLRGPVESQNFTSPAPEKRVFLSSGWLDPSVSPEAQGANQSSVSPPESSAMITGLQAFSTYQMRVVSINVAGSVTSEWTTARTMEGAPELMAPPEVYAVSSTSLKVTWSSAEGHGVIARGKVTEYRVNLLTKQSSNPYAPPVISQVLHRAGPSSQPVYIVKGLKPYHVYNFTVTLCTRTGCTTSLPSTGRTLPAVPSGLSPPRLNPMNQTTIHIDWDPPAQLNGPRPLYQLERTDISLSDPRGPVVRGTRFPGSSYYRFPNDTLPVNTDFTGVELSFRTRSPDGLLLCAFSPGNQEEFLALQIKNGRPYFLFDPQGSAVSVSVHGDGGHRYDDGQWHSVMATRRGAVGTIVVNNQYRGSASASSGSTIIGENTGVFIGGLPEDFTLLREDSGDAQLVRQGFSGCLRDVSFKVTDSPSEEWKPLDWATATDKVAAYESWEGCPAQTADGAHFLGQGYLALDRAVFSGGEDFDIAMEFRTDQLNALLLFTYNTHSEDYMLVELEGGLLFFILSWGGHVTELSMWVGLSYCDGDWSQISLGKRGSVISAAVNDWGEEMRVVGGAGRVRVNSPVYLGGVPAELIHPALATKSHKHGLGGCIRGVAIQSHETNPPVILDVNLSAASRRSVRVNLDGCPKSESRFSCRGNDSVLVYTGRETQARDYTLQPFTEYLYRYVALAAGGWTAGPWERGRSRGTVPRYVPPPSTVQSESGFSAKVSWAPPTGDVRGVIDRYELRAYDRDRPDATPVKAIYPANGNFTGVLSGLTPFTRYIVTVSACTPVGCTESLYNENSDDDDGKWSLTTPEEAPEAVSPPVGVSSSSALYVTWGPPARPNGGITEYLLYHNDRTVYRGNDRQLNITGLGVYSTHVLVLTACTSAGCTNSSQVTMLTSQLPPGPLQPPTLTPLDSRTILVEWSRPSQVNGVLESYSLFLSRDGAEPVLAYNSSELFEDHTLRNLTPGTAYTVTLTACTGGGCTLSPPSRAQTEESTPENVPAPLVTPLSPHALNVSWTPPDTPNGVITSYGVWLDGALVLNSSSSQRFFVVEGLSPWSQHILRLQACTAQGCGKGPVVEMRTLEMAPQGPVLLELTNQGSRSLRARWTAPPRPNGNLSYTLYYKSKDGAGVLDGSTAAGSWLSVTDLQPYTKYSFWIRGCNMHGCVESLPRNITTPPAAPDGLSPPSLAHASGASLNVSWSAPAHANAPGPLRYSLHMRESPQRPVISLLENATDAFSYSVEGLSPYTQYLFRVVVSHTHGQTASPWASMFTAEDSPGPVNTPAVSGLHPHSATVSWVPPSQPNGLITNYTLYLHPSSSSTLPPNPSPLPSPSTNLNPSPMSSPSTSQGPGLNSGLNLRPTSSLTTPGSSHVSRSTVNAGSNGISNTIQGTFPNFLPNPVSSSRPGNSEGNQTGSNTASNTSQGPSSISFQPTKSSTISSASLGPSPLLSSPQSITTSSQGPIDNPISSSTSAPSDVISSPLSVTVPGNTTSYTFLNLLPYQIYSLQVEACTSVGCSLSGTSQLFRTPPAAPEGVPAPHLYSDTPTSVLLSWGAPERSNGPLEGWLVERRVAGTNPVSTVGSLPPAAPPLSFLDSSSALSPWTSYQYRLAAHTQAGSATGPWVNITTRPSRPAGLSPPRVTVLGPQSLQVAWSPPLIPNGEIPGYEIRLPDPRVSHDNVSELNVTVTGLVPYTNYSVTVLACSKGGGHVGGCTESLPTPVTTLPTIPQGLAPLAVVAVSESFLAVSWQPPSKPSGPNIRYELLRCKTHQPLAIATVPTVTAPPPPPSEDLHRWLHVYSGTKLFYQDKGLSRFTWYQYQLLVYNDVGYTSGEIVTAVTMAGVPLRPPSLSAFPINHTAVQVNWTQPSLQDLQGEVESYFLMVDSTHLSRTLAFPLGIISTVISDLWPSTAYRVSLQVSNGAHNTTTTVVNVTTKDGEPEGMSAPEVVPVNGSVVRVLWFPPLRPNGAVTAYRIYLNNHLHGSVDSSSGSYLLGDLLPFTVYNVQVEVCTVYACVRSNVTQTTTVEDLPADLAVPHTQVLSPRAVRLEWASPGRPSGIMLGYEVLRRTLRSCGGGSAVVTTPSAEESGGGGGGGRARCSYLQCPATHGVCGTSCFQPDTQVCCDRVLYTKKPNHQCCEGRYLTLSNSSHSVCCGGKLLPPLPDHQCCGGYYVPVETSEHCCPDPSQGRVSVGLGDSCCGGVPYSMKGGQLCCGGALHDGYGTQCCGGQVVDDTLVCCGDAEREEVHTHTPGFACCGQEYINSSTSLCCVGQDGYPTMHPAGNATMTLQCCGSKVIHQEEECCNGIGYDPERHVCADRPTPGLLTQPQCLQGAVCPIAAASTAYCGSCDLDPSTAACTWVLSARTHPDTHTSATTYSPSMTAAHGTDTTYLHTHSSDDAHGVADARNHTHSEKLRLEGSLCASHEEVVYSGDANRYTYTDSDLEPFTTYEYRVRGWNSFGQGSSDVTTVTTNEDKPWGVAPPRWSRLGDRDDIIQLHWQAPSRPNGNITHYVVLRDGQERYRGDENSFTDVGGIRPFQEYSYQLRACNRAGCTDSAQMMAVTVQGVPEGVQSPMVTALSPSFLHVSWSEPTRANGIVQRYLLNQTGTGTIYTHTGGPRNYTVTGLQPYTDYSFVLVACTAVGCGGSLLSTGRTLQASPAGVWSRPRHLIINTSAVELYWDQPSRPNGQISWYRLIRDGRTVFTGEHRDQNHTDAGLLPNRRYVYELEASTGGGSSVSDRYVIQTPVSCPTGIPPPHNVTVSGPRSIFLAWTPPAWFNSSQPVNYNILLNPGSDTAITRLAGQNLHLSVTGLEPFTTYYIRVQACQIDGCGVGEGVYARTFEAPPEGLPPPTVKAAGAKVLEIQWSPPHKPNGLITSYYIYRRPVGTEEELLVFIWSNGPLEFIDASHALRPFSQYQYRVRAHNSKGSVLSQWASALTLEAGPEDMAPPIVTPTSAYSVHLKWSEPHHPNGLISHYRLVYKKHQQDPTLNSSTVTALTVEGSVLEATLYGLEPYSEYSLRVEAVNGAGSVSSPWVGTRTLEASPAGLANFTVEQREQGRALLLSWDQPHTPNGVITMYNLYSEGNLEFSGLSRHFLFRRLEPWTIYTLTLEVCTSAGCTRTPPQHVTTAAAPPASQPPPRPLFIGPDRVSLSWGPPSQPNGPIAEYFLLGRSLEEGGRGRSNEEDVERGKVLFRETSPQEFNSFSYTVTGLRPWTQYQFSVRAHNPAGHTRSPWVTVTTRQGPPRGLAPPTVLHLQGRPSELLVSWAPPLESNGVLLSYRIQRNSVSFSFSFDPAVLSYTDEDLLPFSPYSYAVIACTSEGCVTSPHTNITTLEAPPATVEAPAMNNITSHSINISWSVPLTQNGEVTEYVLKLNNKEAYRGRGLYTVLSDLRPHISYQLVLLACTSGGCTPSATVSTVTEEAPPTGLPAPTLKVTGPESVEVSWRAPEHPNGIITGYELRRDGEVIYVGSETRYHDFTLLPSVEYSYVVRANNSRGAVSSTAATARTHPSAPSGVAPPTLQPAGPSRVRVEWSAPARPNGEIVSYTVYQRDPVQLSTNSTVFTPEHSTFSDRHVTLHGLAPHRRYEVRVEACTVLGCSSSDWTSILTPEAPPAGQTAPLLDLQPDTHTGLQTSFLLTWSPPARANGRVLHYEVYRRLDRATDARGGAVTTFVCRNVSTSCRDEGLRPYTAYQYQVWVVNSAGRSASPWSSGRTGPAPPEGVAPPTFRRVSATSAVVDIRPPARSNGIVSLYRVFSLHHNNHTLLSEGTSHQQTLYGLSPYTQYWVGVEACTCYQCCSRGPLNELQTLAAPPAHQPPPRPLTLTSRSAQLEWDEPLVPNGVIESCELHVRSSCPPPPQPVPVPCVVGPIETRFFGKGRKYNVTGLQPYSNYELRAACFNNMGSTASNWTNVTTLTEAPQYLSPFSVGSNLTMVWLDWGESFSLNGPLKEYSVTESRLRVYAGFHSYLHVPRTSQKTLSFQVTCTTNSGSASTPTIRYSPATGLGPTEPTGSGQQGVSMSATPVYSELWFILLLALLGLFLLAILLGLVLHRALRKNPSARERPPLITLQKTRQAGGESYMFDTVADCVEVSNVTLKSYTVYTEGLTDTKIVGGGSRFSPMSALRVPSQTDLSHAYSQHSLHRSVSQLIDRKSLMDEGSWDNPLGHDSGLYVEEDEFVDAIKAFSSVRKEHTMFTDTHL